MKKLFLAMALLLLLAIVNIVLKLAGVIAWSWLWVLAPLWIPAELVFLVCCAMLIAISFAKLPDAPDADSPY